MLIIVAAALIYLLFRKRRRRTVNPPEYTDEGPRRGPQELEPNSTQIDKVTVMPAVNPSYQPPEEKTAAITQSEPKKRDTGSSVDAGGLLGQGRDKTGAQEMEQGRSGIYEAFTQPEELGEERSQRWELDGGVR